MRVPRVSIALLMVVVGVIAADAAVWREEVYTLLPPVDSKQPFVWLVIPMLDALAVGGVALTAQVVRRREGSGFLLGFEVTGATVVLALVALYWADGGPVDASLRVTKDALDVLLRRVGLVTHIGDYYTPFWHDLGTPLTVCGLISIPPFLLAGLGGWLFRRYGGAIVRRGPGAPEEGR
jgi:hypothetical protein